MQAFNNFLIAIMIKIERPHLKSARDRGVAHTLQLEPFEEDNDFKYDLQSRNFQTKKLRSDSSLAWRGARSQRGT